MKQTNAQKSFFFIVKSIQENVCTVAVQDYISREKIV